MQEVKIPWSGAVFVCTHERDDGRNYCGRERGSSLRKWLKDQIRAEDLRGVILAATTGCQGICSPDVTVSISPDPKTKRPRQMLIVDAEVDRDALWVKVKSCLLGDDG